MISKKAKLTFQNLCESARDHRLCLAQVDDVRTGKKVNVVCETYVENGVTVFNPLAKFFNGNPYNEVAPVGTSAHKLI